jgi:hypothetical protein
MYLSSMKCPKCLGSNVKKIVYGMPDIENFDFDKYQVGGCTGGDDGPKHWCTDCEEGFSKPSRQKVL